jgi:DNA replication protein DnaC
MTMSDTAAQAAIGAAARELHLPTVRDEALRLAESAVRERQTYLAFLAEVLAAEVDERSARRRTRRITEARFPRLKRLADFDVSAAPTIQPAQLAALASGNYLDAGEPVVLLGDSEAGKHCAFLLSGCVKQSRLGALRLDTQPFAASAVDVNGGEFATLDLV